MNKLDKVILKQKVEDILARDEGFREDVRSDELIQLFIDEDLYWTRENYGNHTYLQNMISEMGDKLTLLKQDLFNPDHLELMGEIEEILDIVKVETNNG